MTTTYDLVIDAETIEGVQARGQYCYVRLTDLNGNEIAGTIGSTNIVISASKKIPRTGSVTFDLPANAQYAEANTYYTVTIADHSWLILKTAATQTLPDATIASGDTLGPATRLEDLADTTGLSAAADGDVPVWDEPTEQWIPGTPVTGASGPAGGVLAGTYPNPSFAADMATQAELDAIAAAKANLDATGVAAQAAAWRTALGLGTAAQQPTGAFDAAGAAAAAQAASQPVDSDLTAISALTTTAYGRAFLALTDAAAGRTALGLGTAATFASTAFDTAGAAAAAQAASQPLDSDLTAIAALTTTSYGRSLLEAANAASLRTLAGVDAAGILALLLTVDGAGSGLDADLLDGLSSAAFATAPLYAVKNGGDESVTSSSALQNDDQLVIAAAANTTYEMTELILFEAATTGDITVDWTLPASATMIGVATSIQAGVSTVGGNLGMSAPIVGGSAVSFGGAGAGTAVGIIVRAFVTTAGSAGNVQTRWAQRSGDLVATIVYGATSPAKYSAMTLRKVA